jgi:hypothetical protein
MRSCDLGGERFSVIDFFEGLVHHHPAHFRRKAAVQVVDGWLQHHDTACVAAGYHIAPAGLIIGRAELFCKRDRGLDAEIELLCFFRE